jgi:mannose-6-phosphate isomerase-like protein (cupin superfamily)
MIEKRAELGLEKDLSKWDAVNAVDEWRFQLGLIMKEGDFMRPWGAFWKFSDEDTEEFIEMFFPETKNELEQQGLEMSPKFLLVAPHEELSWQYHERRAENWKVIAGEVEIKLSETDEIPDEAKTYGVGEMVSIGCGTRHRLIGKEGWGLVAEIWKHTDTNNPSDEEDIVRLADDYGREN